MSGTPTVLVAVNGSNLSLANLLREHEIRVRVARSGVEVVSYLFPRGDSYSEPPSMMVLSALLPGYNGLSVLAGVRSFGWQTPVVMTWPSQEAWIRDEALRLGCSGLFREPVPTPTLAESVLETLGRIGANIDRLEMRNPLGPPQGTAA